jgi:hypothetical protein
VARLLSLPLRASSGWGFYVAGMSILDVTHGVATESAMLRGQLLMLAMGLACGIPGLMALLVRSYVDIDNDLARVTNVRQYGPVRITKTVPLARIKQVRTTAEHGEDETVYYVELVGPRPAQSILVGFSHRRAECQVFAKDLRRALKIPFVGLSYTRPDAD